MKIRSKIILVTFPLILMPLILSLIVSTLSARNGITRVATEFLTFKTEVLSHFMDTQWALLVENDLLENEDFLKVSKQAVQSYAQTLISNEEEKIFALDGEGELVMATFPIDSQVENAPAVQILEGEELNGWSTLEFMGLVLVGNVSYFEAFDWQVFVTVERSAFYDTVTVMIYRTLVIFLISLLAAIIMLMIFSSYLTKPLETVVDVIRNIISTNDLSSKVELLYNDETGTLGHYFNIMTEQLDMAYDQMKRYALQAVVARHKESKIRNIFQKYVPRDVIDRFYSHPEGMLIGENRVLAVLFSDIRSFTTISEHLEPEEVVESLNKYFEIMVDTITRHHGIVDKYIGDAIMAFFGAPVPHHNDALNAVKAALGMLERLGEFNEWQEKQGRPEFKIGIGLNYGPVTIGNIGSEKKMDYTVIGDMVNTASRMEGLTKLYKEPLLISESVYQMVREELPCRMIDKVIVKGKTESTKIYSVARSIDHHTREAWESHEKGIELYYHRKFSEAISYFDFSRQLLKNDHCSRLFFDRCMKYIEFPPGDDWTGDTVLNRK